MTKNTVAKDLKQRLSIVVRRRNGIAHEGDLQPAIPREPLPISRADLILVGDLIEKLVKSIDSVA